MAHDIDMTVLGGLPVTIEFTMAGADPSVGIMSSYCEEWVITHINGRKCKKEPNWLYERIAARKGEEDRIIEACGEYADDYDGF
jgi:hypothetical protein